MTTLSRSADWRPLRIAMTSYYLPSESKIGVGFQAHGMANALADLGHQVVMFSPCAPVDDARYYHRHVPIRGSLRTFQWAWRVRELDLDGFDVLHAHGDDHLRLGRPTPPHVRTLHGSCFDEALHIKGTKERLRMAALGCTEMVAPLVADATVCVSNATRRWNPWLHKVIPNGVDLSSLPPGGSSGTGANHPLRRHLRAAQAGPATRGRVRADHPSSAA